jgi:hypothetical protein
MTGIDFLALCSSVMDSAIAIKCCDKYLDEMELIYVILCADSLANSRIMNSITEYNSNWLKGQNFGSWPKASRIGSEELQSQFVYFHCLFIIESLYFLTGISIFEAMTTTATMRASCLVRLSSRCRPGVAVVSRAKVKGTKKQY